MLRKILAAASVATVAAAFSLGASGTASSAAIGSPLTVANAPTSTIRRGLRRQEDSHNQEKHRGHVVKKPERRLWVYDSHRTVHRYRHRHGTYVYYYGGWYYPRPWWTIRIGG